MKNIILKKISIQNFKGIASGEFDFNEKSTEITADVMQGKSTIKLAYLFALGIEINDFYPTDKNNKFIDGLLTKVELELSIDNIDYKLSRSAKIQWKVDRDNDTKVFNGFDKAIYEFDIIPCNATQYKQNIVEKFGVSSFDLLKVVSILNYFNEELEWKQRREIIYNMFVDKTSIDGLKDNEKYKAISNELQKGYSSAEISTILNSENLKVVDNRRRNSILLEEKQTELSNFVAVDYDTLEKEMQEIDRKIKIEEDAILNNNEQSARNEIQSNIQKLSAEKLELERNFTSEKNKLSIAEIQKTSEVRELQSKGNILKAEIDEKTEKYKQIRAKQFDNSQEKCSSCGQTLPADKIDNIKSTWESVKEKQMSDLAEQIKPLKAQYAELQQNYENLVIEKNQKSKEFEELVMPAKVNELETKIAELNGQLNNVKPNEMPQILNDFKARKNELTIALGNKTAKESCEKRILELQEEQKSITNSEILLANRRKQLEEYTLDIIDLVNDSINANFVGVEFKLFEVLTANAKKDLKETLVVMNNGVVYEAMSTGQKAYSNLQIIDTLQKKLGICSPIFIDDASITNIKDLPNNQIIFLYNEKGAELKCTKIKEIY